MAGVTDGLNAPVYGMFRNPRNNCGSESPFDTGLGYSSAKGYRYKTPQTGNGNGAGKGFSLAGFVRETLIGGVTGGLGSAAFYGAGEAVRKIKGSLWSSKGKTKKEILEHNKAIGKAYADKKFAKFKTKYRYAEREITIKMPSGVKVRVDAIGLNAKGHVIIHELKASKTASLTRNQKRGFPEMYLKGGIVVGKGKGIFKTNYIIPAGTKVKVVRPIIDLSSIMRI